jgi:hypothetical protein
MSTRVRPHRPTRRSSSPVMGETVVVVPTISTRDAAAAVSTPADAGRLPRRRSPA